MTKSFKNQHKKVYEPALHVQAYNFRLCVSFKLL